jgi:phosphoribosylanthranilate isomerase
MEVSPWGVDTAGGVEDSVGDMDVERVVQFVRNARAVGGRMGVKSDG